MKIDTVKAYNSYVCFNLRRNQNDRNNTTACCALYVILFVVELVEGKEHLHQAGPIDFEDLGGNTVGLLLRMMKSYFFTGGYVILDSGFCVLKWLIQLRKKGVFSCAVIKKGI